ncbi:MAG TPA: hypothetical protein VK348_01660 [Planctomycetota bacterium]|nr:hypothetical protein [Planctomycetota bacterium]
MRRPLRSFAALLATAIAGRAQLHTVDAAVGSPELPRLSEQVDYVTTAHVFGLTADTELTWSPTTWLEAGIEQPWYRRRVAFGDPASGRLRDTLEGRGDMVLHSKLALLRENAIAQSDSLSLLMELSLPTGAHDAAVAGVELPRRQQLGLGATGAGLGIAYTAVRYRERTSAAFVWRHFGNHDGFDPGEELELDLAWSYRLQPRVFDASAPEPEWRLCAELLGKYRTDDQERSRGMDGGGSEIHLELGLYCQANGWLCLQSAVRVPLYADLGDPFGNTWIGCTFAVQVTF